MDTILDRAWKPLVQEYNKNGIALVLGAGVSCASNIPSWVELLGTLSADRNAFNEWQARGISLPAIASLLQEQSGDRTAFVNKVRDVLYADFPFYGDPIDKNNRWEFAKYIREGEVREERRKERWKEGVEYRPNLTLRSVGALCVIQRERSNGSGKKYNFANPKVRGIVTLNMDALLESYVYACTTKHLIRTVERASARSYPNVIQQYHVHGYLHFDRTSAEVRQSPRRGEAMEAVVLTEQDYYDFFNEPNSLFNYTLLYHLREHTCLFIGLSMDDVNIRRLLHYSKLERLQAFADRENITLDQLAKRKPSLLKKVRRHYAILQHDKEYPQVDAAREQTLEPLGVHVLWVDEFTEIRDRLKEMYESERGGKRVWANVYDRIT